MSTKILAIKGIFDILAHEINLDYIIFGFKSFGGSVDLRNAFIITRNGIFHVSYFWGFNCLFLLMFMPKEESITFHHLFSKW